jgi:transcriptional regulator with XRE-family HTH domain
MPELKHDSCTVCNPLRTQEVDGHVPRAVFKCYAMNYKKEIGRRLAERRTEFGWSLEELSRRTQGILSKSRLGNYEQGTRTPGPMEANILGEVLKVDAAYLMCLQQSFTKQELDLLRNFRALPEKDRNDYQRRIGALAMIYREPVADERLEELKTKAPAKASRRQPRNH